MSSTVTPEVADTLHWKCHPSRRSLLKTALVLALLHALMFFTIWYTESVFIGIVVMTAMVLSLGAYFFPTWYTLTDKGVTVKSLVAKFERPWTVYRSHWPDKNGVLLSPFPGPSRLENFRGLFVRFENNRDDVVAFVKRFVPEPER
jgi:hypothetical protein